MRLDAQENGETRRERFFSQDFCAALDDSAMPIYIIDPENFKVLYCNHSMCRYLGKDVTGGLCYKAIRGLDAPCESCTAMRLYRDGDDKPKEFRHPLGVWVLLQASLLQWRGRELVKITSVDITRQKQMEDALRLRNQEYAAVVRQSVTGIVRYDIATDTAVTNINRDLDRVEEYSIPNYSQVIRKSCIVEPGSADAALAILNDLRRGVPSRGYHIQASLGRRGPRWFRVDYVLIENELGKPDRAVLAFHDNTEQHEKELAYQIWTSKLNALMDEHTAYMEVNLTRDVIENESWAEDVPQTSQETCFSKNVLEVARIRVAVEDAQSFRNFFNRERLMGAFYAGKKEDSLEYLALVSGQTMWHRVELQMVSDPFNGDIKASIVLSNVDFDKRERERLNREAERDALTGLYNRATAERLIRQILERDTGEKCCFLLIDLDDLCGINSALGHPEGDRALKAIAEAMMAQFGPGDILGRIGGDEFVALMRDMPDADRPHTVITGFMNRLTKVKIGPLRDQPVHVSVGGTMGTAGVDVFKNLYKQADLALFYTKATGKNALNFYVPGMEEREFLYQSRSTVSVMRPRWYESKEFKKLLEAMAAVFSLVISVNLTKNTYYMMEYMAYTTQKAKDDGSFDQLIADGAASFHPEDRQGFLDSFGREQLLKAHAQGRQVVAYTGRQLGDDGIYRKAQTIVIFVKDEDTDDICEITLAHVQPPEIT